MGKTILPDGVVLRGILKSATKQRCFSESQVSDLMMQRTPSETSGSSIAEEDDDDEGSTGSSSKKSVRFNEIVQRKVFRPTSSITGMTAKNQKKKEQKRKRAERRASESDGDEMGKTPEDAGALSSHDDSGVASSVDEGMTPAPEKNGGVAEKTKRKGGRGKRRGGKKQQQKLLAEAANDLIFDLDI